MAGSMPRISTGVCKSSPNWYFAIRTLLNKNSIKIKIERKEKGVEVKY